MVSLKGLNLIIAAVGHHLDTIATDYDGWFNVFDHLYNLKEGLLYGDVETGL